MEEIMWLVIGCIISVALISGYLINIYRLIKQKEVNGLTFARVCGIFIFPIGAIVGFISN
jgi:hypothetical protein